MERRHRNRVLKAGGGLALGAALLFGGTAVAGTTADAQPAPDTGLVAAAPEDLAGVWHFQGASDVPTVDFAVELRADPDAAWRGEVLPVNDRRFDPWGIHVSVAPMVKVEFFRGRYRYSAPRRALTVVLEYSGLKRTGLFKYVLKVVGYLDGDGTASDSASWQLYDGSLDGRVLEQGQLTIRKIG